MEFLVKNGHFESKIVNFGVNLGSFLTILGDFRPFTVGRLGHFGEIIQIWAFQGHKIPYFDINSLKMCFIHPLNQLEAISSNL